MVFDTAVPGFRQGGGGERKEEVEEGVGVGGLEEEGGGEGRRRRKRMLRKEWKERRRSRGTRRNLELGYVEAVGQNSMRRKRMRRNGRNRTEGLRRRGRGGGGVWWPVLTDRVAVQFSFTRRV